MQKKTLGIMIGVICSLLIVCAYVATKPQTFSKQNAEQKQTFTKTVVAKHNSKTDCWTIIDGQVYDITEYISAHPGGSEILRACGKDSTELFNTRRDEGGERIGSGTAHSSSAELALESFRIGTLSN
jgi:cytochrome b involved in lipid metabolism